MCSTCVCPDGELVTQMRITLLFLYRFDLSEAKLLQIKTYICIYSLCIKVSVLNSELFLLHNVIALQTRNK